MVKRSISLRYKILLALTILPLTGLSLLLMMAVDLFEKDKIAYVFDSSLSVSKTKASRVRTEMGSLTSLAQSIVLTYSRDTKTLSESGKVFFDSESKIEGLQLFAIVPGPVSGSAALVPGPISGSAAPISTMSATSFGPGVAIGSVRPETGPGTVKVFETMKTSAPKALLPDEAKKMLDAASKDGIAIRRLDGDQTGVWLALRFGAVDDPNRLYGLVAFRSFEVAEAFNESGSYMSFLLRAENGSPFYAQPLRLKGGKEWLPNQIWSSLSSNKLPEGIEEVTAPSKQNYLVSFATVGLDNLVVVSLVDKAAALSAVNMLLSKAIVFSLAILALTVIISVLASRGMTSALGNLLFATQRVTEGDFQFRVDVTSQDEFGALGNSFNTMAEEVARLMKETAEKARMESELATAKTVQETLFPENSAKLGPVRISGHYTPASECGGDWWYHCEIGNLVYIWVGDATGHGAPAALLTSAARAVASVIQMAAPTSPSESIALLNRAIWDTSKGKMMMTFFLGCINKDTGVMEYVNASHEPPLLLRKFEGVPARDDYEALNEVNNPRLGEDPKWIFKQASIQLNPGDQFFLYTDGIIDAKNPEAKVWGERKFLKALSTSLSENPEPDAVLSAVIHTFEDYRKQTPLDDDVTLVLIRFDGNEEALQGAA